MITDQVIWTLILFEFYSSPALSAAAANPRKSRQFTFIQYSPANTGTAVSMVALCGFSVTVREH